jgi:DNA polymerase III subunit epsilon
MSFLFLIHKKENMSSIIFFDFETTGLDILGNNATDKIIQFMFLESESMEYYSSFVNPEKKISPKTIKLNGITSFDVERYKPFSFYLPKIIDFIGTETVYLVAHNGDSFDKPLLLQEMRKNGFPVPPNWFFIDSLKLSRKFLTHLPNHKMDTLRKHFNLSHKNSHLATKDVCDLQSIYQKLVGDKTPDEIYTTCEEIKQYMSFGEHKNELIKDVPIEYLIWALRNSVISPTKNCDTFEQLCNSRHEQIRYMTNHILNHSLKS